MSLSDNTAADGAFSRKRKAPDSSTSNETIHSLNPKDVLLGRGQHVRNEGNITFRTLVRACAAEYHSNYHKGGKDAIARRIIRDFVRDGGRFVKQKAVVGDMSTWDEATLPVYENADEATVLIKVKQTMRDYSVILRRAAAAAERAPVPPNHGNDMPRSDQVDPSANPPSDESAAHGTQGRAFSTAAAELPSALPVAAPVINPPPPDAVTAEILRMLQQAQQRQAQQQQLLNGLVSMFSPPNSNAHGSSLNAASVLSQAFFRAPPNPQPSAATAPIAAPNPMLSSQSGWNGPGSLYPAAAQVVAPPIPQNGTSATDDWLAMFANLTSVASSPPHQPTANVGVDGGPSNEQHINAVILSLLQASGGNNAANQRTGNTQQPPQR
jgi:hypothetical protein